MSTYCQNPYAARCSSSQQRSPRTDIRSTTSSSYGYADRRLVSPVRHIDSDASRTSNRSSGTVDPIFATSMLGSSIQASGSESSPHYSAVEFYRDAQEIVTDERGRVDSVLQFTPHSTIHGEMDRGPYRPGEATAHPRASGKTSTIRCISTINGSGATQTSPSATPRMRIRLSTGTVNELSRSAASNGCATMSSMQQSPSENQNNGSPLSSSVKTNISPRSNGFSIGTPVSAGEMSCNSGGYRHLAFQKGKVVGSGGFGVVYQGILSDGRLVAVKEMKLETNAKAIDHEVHMLSALPPHPNCVRYLGSRSTRHHYYIIMEFISGGSIQSLRATVGKLKESVMRQYAQMVLTGLYHLHSHGIVHRDIKGGNVLLDERGVAKIVDFGCCKDLNQGGTTIGGGTPLWMAPEVCRGSPASEKSDVWSVGCLCLEMINDSGAPWSFPQSMTLHGTVYAIACATQPPAIPKHLSPLAQNFLESCLRLDPEQRSSVGELLSHPFFGESMRNDEGALSSDEEAEDDFGVGSRQQSLGQTYTPRGAQQARIQMKQHEKKYVRGGSDTRSTRTMTSEASPYSPNSAAYQSVNAGFRLDAIDDDYDESSDGTLHQQEDHAVAGVLDLKSRGVSTSTHTTQGHVSSSAKPIRNDDTQSSSSSSFEGHSIDLENEDEDIADDDGDDSFGYEGARVAPHNVDRFQRALQTSFAKYGGNGESPNMDMFPRSEVADKSWRSPSSHDGSGLQLPGSTPTAAKQYSQHPSRYSFAGSTSPRSATSHHVPCTPNGVRSQYSGYYDPSALGSRALSSSKHFRVGSTPTVDCSRLSMCSFTPHSSTMSNCGDNLDMTPLVWKSNGADTVTSGHQLFNVEDISNEYSPKGRRSRKGSAVSATLAKLFKKK